MLTEVSDVTVENSVAMSIWLETSRSLIARLLQQMDIKVLQPYTYTQSGGGTCIACT